MRTTTRRYRSEVRSARLLLAGALGVAMLLGMSDTAAAGVMSPSQVTLSGNPLVSPTVEALLGGEQEQLARNARRSAPAALARRQMSRFAFEGLSPRRAAEEAKSAYPSIVEQAAGTLPQLAAGGRVVRYLTDHAAQVALPGRSGVIESLAPIASQTSQGAHVPFDLRLVRDGRFFSPARSPFGLRVSSSLRRGVELPEVGVSLVPVGQSGAALAASAAQPEGAGVLWDIANTSATRDLAALAKASSHGFDLSTLLFSRRSPGRLYFRVGMPSGARLEHASDGTVDVVEGPETIATVSPVSAQDAEGSSVPVTETLHGSIIELDVNTDGDYLYPIVVDPEINDSQLATTTSGKRSNWEFFTSNSARFANSAVYEGSGQEHLETKGIAEYAPGEWAYWGYQTQGVSKIYEVKTETTAHNVGAKIESFLELQQLGGVQETKKLLSTEAEGDAEYSRKAATLCAANAGHEECLPAAGQARNAVHFQQSATGSPGGSYRFSDTLAQGIVSIAEPTGTHATTSFTTSAPSFEFETEVEGKKAKVTRANVLYGSGSWLTKSAGALQSVAKDGGIGVAASKLEFEASAGKWEALGEHSYLEHENACKGVQCYPEHVEDWTLSPKLPNGEDKLRYKAEEAIPGTQSLTTEGLATVKVDAAPPSRLSLEGLPYGNELTERPYKLKAQATDGEGAVVASSGIRSLALFVNGREVLEAGKQTGCSVAKGECTASAEWSINGAELGAGRHAIVVVATDHAGNEARLEKTILIKHTTPVSLGPGSVDLQSGDFALGVKDVSLGSGLTVGRNYSSRATAAGQEGPLGPQWSLDLGSSESLVEQVNGSVLLTSSSGAQTIFALTAGGKFESPTGDSNLELTLETNKTTKQKLAYYLKNAAAHTSVKFTLPTGSSSWVPSIQEGTTASDTVTYAYQSVEAHDEYPVSGEAETIVPGPEGDMWFTVPSNDRVGKVTPSGKVTEYPVGSWPIDITEGPEHNMWFTAYNDHTIGSITASGAVTEYAVPGGGIPTSITTGPDGNIWFTEFRDRVVKMTPAGAFTEYAVPTKSYPSSIVVGADGNLWFTEAGHAKIAKITTAGEITEYAISGAGTENLVAGPDGNLWFDGQGAAKIGKITTSGSVTEYPLPAGGFPTSIGVGAEDDLWFTRAEPNSIGKMTESGAVTEFPVTKGAAPEGVDASPNGEIWFTQRGDQIDRMSPSGRVTEPVEELAPKPAGVSCSPEFKPGCRALKFKYATSTTATGEGAAELGEYAGRLSEVLLKAYDPAGKTMREVAVAKYAYDKYGRLRAEWDPRITPNLKSTYGYDGEGHVTSLAAPGQEPWTFAYGPTATDAGTGRLLKAAHAPASSPLWNGSQPANTAVPKITGQVREGVRLAASEGSWSNSPNAYAYQWLRCLRGGCEDIAGATNANYTPGASDAYHDLEVVVTATSGGGSATAVSNATSAVATKASAWAQHALPEGSGAKGMAAGATSKTMWFTDFSSSKIGTITTAGAVSEYALPSGSGPENIVKGSDENMWFTDYTSSKIGKITAGGAITEYALPTNSHPKGIALGSDGDVWFTDYSTNKIGKITTSGTITEYSLPSSSRPYAITAGPDGNLWFTDSETHKVSKITTSGTITEYTVPLGGYPYGIAAGPDGNIWYGYRTGGSSFKIGKLTTAGALTEYALSGVGTPEYVASASGSLWVSGKGAQLARVSTSGEVSVYPMPEGAEPEAIAAVGTELWCAEFNGMIGALQLNVAEGAAKAPEAGITLNYEVPISGAGAPYDLAPAETARWGQSDDPVEAAAVFAEDEPQSWPATSYKRATVYYFDEQGRQVNAAAPSNAPFGAVSTTEYNEFNDVVRTLTPANRQRALEAGAGSAAKSKLLDTENTYNGEGAKEGEVEEPGARLIESLGPQHEITYVAGHEQKEALARLHSKLFYDEGAPSGEPHDLQTKKTTLAQLANEEEVEVRTMKTSYSGQSNLGWKLRAPTSVTTFGPEGSALTSSITEYNSTTGQVIETRGTSAETTLSYAKKFGEAGSEAGKLSAPWGAAVNSEGQLLVVDSANDRVEKFNSEGVYVSSFGSLGSGSGQLKEPQGIALDSAGDVWVADTGNNRLEEFNSSGVFVRTVGSLGTESGKLKAPSALAFDTKGNVWVADTGNNRVEKFNKEGTYISEFGSFGSEPGKLSGPKGIAVDTGEHVWVADTGNNRIQEFSTTGALLERFGSSGAGEGELSTPVDLKLDAEGDVWTVDSRNSRVEEFSPGGGFVTQFGYRGTGAGQLSEPRGLAFDASGRAWVVDSGDSRLEQWSKGPNAHDQKTIYYTAAANTEGYAACGSRPEWVGLVCETLPARQPELMGLPGLPVTTVTYNMYDEPETTTETFGSNSRVRRETYDNAGRRTTSETTATSGGALPKVTFTYNAEQGMLEKETSSGEERSLTSEFNRLGQLVKYTDADGNVAKYSYAGPENDFQLIEASDSSAGATTKQSYEYDPTTKLRTKLNDSAAGVVTAAYDVEGNLASVSYPYGMCAAYSYNSIGEAIELRYLKSSNCAEGEAGVYYQDRRSSSIRGEMLNQASSLSSEIYAYDPSGRLTETQETPVGEGCTVRAYSYDEESDRAGSSAFAPGGGGACQSEVGVVESHDYDEGNRLADGGVTYDPFGNVTKLPAADAEGHELSTSYYVDNAVASQTQSGVTNEYRLDPEGRSREVITGAGRTIDHYDGSGETVAWSESPEKWVRNIAGIDGTLLATQTNGETPILQLHDLQGDVVATIGDKASETKLLSTYNSTEFGVPSKGRTPPKLAYLGALGAESSLASGVITYGATSYVPQTGRALQSETVQSPGLPGGSGAGAPYTLQEEPWNMQGAGQEAAEAPGLEAAREKAALEAAEGAVIDPWVHVTMNRSKAAAKAEEYFEAESIAVVLEMEDLPAEFIELAGKEAGEIVSEFDDAYKWMDDAGNKLQKCAANKRQVNGRDVNICWFEYEQIEWEPSIPAPPFGAIGIGTTLKFPNFSVEPIVNECIYVQGPNLECVANVSVETEL